MDPADEIFFGPADFPPAPTAPSAPGTGYSGRPPAPPPSGWSSPGYAAPEYGTTNGGCGKWILIAVAAVVGFYMLQSCVSNFSSSGPFSSGSGGGTSGGSDSVDGSSGSCPTRVADLIPGGQTSLVDAFETDNHRIILCSDGSGQVYYHGETRGGDDEALLMEAETTADGYLARNATYAYEITGDTVIITNNDVELSRYTLDSWEDPS
ncbi:hypothetical protein [Nocardiopsis oceani]